MLDMLKKLEEKTESEDDQSESDLDEESAAMQSKLLSLDLGASF